MCVFKSKHSGVKAILLVDTGIEKDQYFNLRLKKNPVTTFKVKNPALVVKRWIDVPGFFFIPFVLSDQVIHWVFVGLEESKNIGMGNLAFLQKPLILATNPHLHSDQHNHRTHFIAVSVFNTLSVGMKIQHSCIYGNDCRGWEPLQ